MKNKIGTMILAAAAVAATGVFAKDDAEAALKARLPGIFAKAAAHYRALDAAATPLMKGKVAKMVEGKSDLYVPHGWKDNAGRLDMRSIFWWTSGNFPGSLWYLYKATGDDFFKSRALAWTSILAPNSKVTTSHDFAYVMNCSFGNAKRILGTDRYDALLAETAETLAKRYDPRLGLIRSWGPIGDKKHFLVIPDNLMLLELLEVVSKMPGGDKRFDEMARSHADMTMKHHFRADGEIGHFLLKHGVEHKPAGLKIDTPLDYGDYYYLEALLRLSK